MVAIDDGDAKKVAAAAAAGGEKVWLLVLRAAVMGSSTSWVATMYVHEWKMEGRGDVQ